MSGWRRRALEALPDLKQTIESARNPMSLWIELQAALELAYRKPGSEERIGRIYEHALWVLRESHDDAIITAVTLAFFEDLPANKAVREDLHRWIPPDVFHGLSGVFQYHLSEEEWDSFRAGYTQRRLGRLGVQGAPRRRTRACS